MPRPGPTPSTPRLLAVVPACVCLLLAGCRTVDVTSWNLKEVHEPDGSPKRRGDLRNAFEYTLEEMLSLGAFGSPKFLEDSDETINDPLGECLDNLATLLRTNQDDPYALGVSVEMVTWLGGDCTYLLSRERCASALGELGLRLGVTRPIRLADGSVPASADEVGSMVEELLRTVRTTLDGSTPGGPDGELAAATKRIAGATLDRDGARRVLAVTNILLDSQGFERPALGLVRSLHDDLLPVCIGLTLGVMLVDVEPRVRADAHGSWIVMTRGEDPEPFESAWRGSEEELLAATRALAKSGAPVSESASSADRARAETYWMDRVVNLLGRVLDGPIQVSACRAMARLSGREQNLHPEVWTAWWEDSQAGFALDGRASTP